jgi:cytoskeletal protein CcmA (bactofilin family)
MESPAQSPEEVNALEAAPDAAGGGSDSLEGGDKPAPEQTPTEDKQPSAGKNKPDKPKAGGPGTKKGLSHRMQGLLIHVNIYLLIFILILVIAIVITFVGWQRNKKELAEPTITTGELTQEDLEEINNSETKVGDPKQTLTIESNAIFSGKVLVRDDLDVAGTIKVGSALNLPGITVAGTSSFDQLQTNRLSVNGDGSINGTLSVQRSLTVAGGATFGGPVSAPSLSVQSLQISNDLTVTRHIDAGGGPPSSSNGTAVGSGGTASVSGTDTAGTVNINTGGGPPAGCFVTVNFNIKFNGTPHVVVTPVGSAAGALDWYINRNSSNFSICTTSPPPAGQGFGFDYIVID